MFWTLIGQTFKFIFAPIIIILFICLIYSLFLGKSQNHFIKKLSTVCLIYIAGMIIIAVLKSDSHTTISEFDWNPALFESKSQVYKKELALVAAEMSEKSEDETGDEIKKLYNQYGIGCIELYYDGADDFTGGSAFAIGQGKISINEEDTLVLVITARGSNTVGEFIGDWLKGWIWEKSHVFEGMAVWDNVYDFEENMWNGLDDYIKKYPAVTESENLKILVTGHSLGGAAACMVGARLNNGIGGNEWWSDKVRVEDIYVYTFGSIKIFVTDDNVSVGYENIHNLYNYYDSFGPYGNQSRFNASSPNAKFGHTEIFYPEPVPEENRWIFSCVNHEMSTYVDAVKKELIDCSRQE